MSYFKSIDQMKDEVEARNNMSSTERVIKSVAEINNKLERQRRIEEQVSQQRDALIALLVSNKDIYQLKYDEAVKKKNEYNRVVFKDILTLVENPSAASERLSISAIESLLPDENGNVNVDVAKKVIASIMRFIRIK